MISVPTSVAQLLGDIRVPFQGGRGRAKELYEPVLWRCEWHHPQGECMIRHRVNLTCDRGRPVGKDPAQHTGRRRIGVCCVGANGSHHAAHRNRDAKASCDEKGHKYAPYRRTRRSIGGNTPDHAGIFPRDCEPGAGQSFKPTVNNVLQTPGETEYEG
jgi:hypothetical protein